MYKLLRNTHLALGVFCFLSLMVYGLSSVQMAHPQWFTMRPTTTEMRVTVPAEATTQPRRLARALMEDHGIRGDMRVLTTKAAGYSFRIVKPGMVYEVEYPGAGLEVLVRRHVAGFMGMLNRIHHVGGLWHDDWLLNVWGVLVAIISCGLIVLSLTGIYLWFKIHGERKVGVVLLAASLGYSTTLIVLLRGA